MIEEHVINFSDIESNDDDDHDSENEEPRYEQPHDNVNMEGKHITIPGHEFTF